MLLALKSLKLKVLRVISKVSFILHTALINCHVEMKMAERVVATNKISVEEQKCLNSCKQNSNLNSSGSSADRIQQLQKTAGNQAVKRLTKSGVLQAKLKIS